MAGETERVRSGQEPASFLRQAGQADVVRRALRYAVVVGAVLIAINQGDAILEGRIGARELAKMGLTVLVPYLVSTFSSVGAMRALRNESVSES